MVVIKNLEEKLNELKEDTWVCLEEKDKKNVEYSFVLGKFQGIDQEKNPGFVKLTEVFSAFKSNYINEKIRFGSKGVATMNCPGKVYCQNYERGFFNFEDKNLYVGAKEIKLYLKTLGHEINFSYIVL